MKSELGQNGTSRRNAMKKILAGSTFGMLGFLGGPTRAAYFNEDLVNFKNGKLYLNPSPGLGVKFDPKKETFLMEITSNTKYPHPYLQSPDGAIHNW